MHGGEIMSAALVLTQRDVIVWYWSRTQLPNPCEEHVSSKISKTWSCLIESTVVVDPLPVLQQTVGIPSFGPVKEHWCYKTWYLPVCCQSLWWTKYPKWIVSDNLNVWFHLRSTCQSLIGKHPARACSPSVSRKSAPTTNVESWVQLNKP